jgi:enterobacterial common antigen flippase
MDRAANAASLAYEAATEVIRALLGIGVLQFVSMLLLISRTKILAVTVGVDGVGTIANVDALTAVIAQTLSLSMPFAALRFLPEALRDSPAQMDLLYRRMRLLLVALLLPAALVCVALALSAPHVFGSALTPYRRTLLLAFAGLPVVGLMPFLINASAGAVGHVQAMRLTIAHTGVMVMSAVAAAAGGGVDAFYAVYAGLGTILVIDAARRIVAPGLAKADRVPLTLRDAVRLPPAMWRFAAWLLPLTFLAPYAIWFVKYSTLRLYGVDAAGILQGAIGISLSVRALLGAAQAVFLTPNVNRQGDAGARMAWANEFQRTYGLLFAVLLPPLLLFSDIALRVLYAPAFLAGSAFVALFVAAEVLSLISSTYQSLIIAGNSMRFHVLQNLGAQVLLAGTAAVALPRLGLAGAGIAAVAAPVFMLGTTLWFLHRTHRVRASVGVVRSSAVAIAILITAGGIGSSYPGLAPGLLAAKAGACVALWLIALVFMPSTDRARLRDALVRVVHRRTLRAPTLDDSAAAAAPPPR